MCHISRGILKDVVIQSLYKTIILDNRNCYQYQNYMVLNIY